MENQRLQIECGRCGETMSETLTEEEARTLKDGIGPIFRHCDNCEKMTGWIQTAAKNSATEEAGGSGNDRPVAHGQERLATASERKEVNSMLYEPDAVQNTK